jgi:hypothetical protein
MGRKSSTYWEKKGAFRVLVANSEAKILLRRPEHRWEDNIKVDVQEILWAAVDWIYLAEDMDTWRFL